MQHDEPQATDAIIEPPPIRLSILHLFFWMTGTAVLLAVNRTLPVMPGMTPLEQGVHFAVIFVSSIGGGIALASLGVLCQYGFRQPAAFPCQPGHWILLALGLVAVVRIGAFCFFPPPHDPALQADGYVEYSRNLLALQAVVNLLVFSIACYSLPRTGWHWIFGLDLVWNFLMISISLNSNAYSIYQVISFASQVEPIFLSLLAWIQMRVDWHAQRDFGQTKRDWLHYCGITVLFVSALRGIALIAWTYLRE